MGAFKFADKFGVPTITDNTNLGHSRPPGALIKKNTTQIAQEFCGGKPVVNEKGLTIYTDEENKKIFEGLNDTIEEKDLEEVLITEYFGRSERSFDDFKLNLFVGKDGARLLRIYKEVSPEPDELIVFLEIDQGVNYFGSVMRVIGGANLNNRKNFPFAKILEFAKNKEITISQKQIQKIIREGVKEKSWFFKFIISPISKATLGLGGFVADKAGDVFFDVIPNALFKLKFTENQWNPKIENFKAPFIPDFIENKLLELAEEDESIIKILVDPFFVSIKEFEKTAKSGLKGVKKYIPNKIHNNLKDLLNTVFGHFDSLKGFLYNDEYGFFDLIRKGLNIANAYLCGIFNSLIDTLAAIFQLIGLLFKGIAAVGDFAKDPGYYFSIALEYIENIIEAVYNIDFVEFFKQLLYFPVKVAGKIFNYFNNSSGTSLEELFYFFGYVVGFIIETLIGIIFTGGSLTAITLNKLLVKTFKEPFELLFKGLKSVIKGAGSLFQKFALFIQFIFNKLKDPKALFKTFYDWLDGIIANSKARVILNQGSVFYSDVTGLFAVLNFAKNHKKALWLKRLKAIDFQYDLNKATGIYTFFYKKNNIFRGNADEAVKTLSGYFSKAKAEGKKVGRYLDDIIERKIVLVDNVQDLGSTANKVQLRLIDNFGNEIGILVRTVSDKGRKVLFKINGENLNSYCTLLNSNIGRKFGLNVGHGKNLFFADLNIPISFTDEFSGLGNILLDDSLKFFQNSRKVNQIDGTLDIYMKSNRYLDYGGESIILKQFWEAVNSGKSIKEAAFSTFAGQWAKKNGFDKLHIDNIDTDITPNEVIIKFLK